MEERLNWRVKQFGVVIGAGSGLRDDALREARRFVYLYEMDDADTMKVEVRMDGEKRWRKMEVHDECD